jgi:hypothetical protein
MIRRFLCLGPVIALLCVGACVDESTEPKPVRGLPATHQATWGLTHAALMAFASDSCATADLWLQEETLLRSTKFMDGSWDGRTFTGSFTHRLLTWDDYLITGTLVATVSEDDSLVTSFRVEQHIVWNQGPDEHRHETARIEYDGPGLVLGTEDYGYVFRVFGTACCENLTVEWATWLEEDPGCVHTADQLSCRDVSSLHVGFYPRD